MLEAYNPSVNVGSCDTLVLLPWLGGSERESPQVSRGVGRAFVPVYHLLLSVDNEEPQCFSKNTEDVWRNFPFFSSTACHSENDFQLVCQFPFHR